MSVLDQIIALYDRQAELQAHSGVGEYLSADERAELAYIPTLLSKAWEKRRLEKLRCDYQSEADYKRARKGEQSTMHRMDTRKEEIYALVQEFGTATSADISKSLGTMAPAQVNTYLMRLRDEGLIIREETHEIKGIKYIWHVADAVLLAA